MSRTSSSLSSIRREDTSRSERPGKELDRGHPQQGTDFPNRHPWAIDSATDHPQRLRCRLSHTIPDWSRSSRNGVPEGLLVLAHLAFRVDSFRIPFYPDRYQNHRQRLSPQTERELSVSSILATDQARFDFGDAYTFSILCFDVRYIATQRRRNRDDIFTAAIGSSG